MTIVGLEGDELTTSLPYNRLLDLISHTQTHSKDSPGCLLLSFINMVEAENFKSKVLEDLLSGEGLYPSSEMALSTCVLTQLERLKPIDLIICHLTLVHIVNFFIALLLQSPHLFASLNFQNDFKCKALSYLSRAMWGLSICTICLLSVLQAITISSSTSCSNRIFYTVAASNVTQINVLNIGKYCSIFPMSFIIRATFLILTRFRDVFLVGIMLFSSAYMLTLLFRHQR
ncbi:putative vomeronasal receptor-like protein 4 isoform X2 [Pongo pygmaeus]|nr:putative vomeronasal receptor-like protein 4 isoform X2 [Pongo pygmaeus]XP_054350287.1 putative vomeronasal receptor-like protein 4 isoform X2 [Pongo pygmaeus]XP_054350288.1 putative vomeronasal receptor-like protein 4 isoform X2 [Pongo pygmaeus]XP_054350289.1 putative vomeronasal receptor-like protein 4 isoform X2 [Pongo pygmaeus]XP_054350291.1 putative vomeronasal receptor-like protein 4 isoform X2 [Pongo pygmaeus]